MTDLLLRLTSETGRRWLYSIGTAAGAIAVGYGILTAEMAALWLGLLAALLGGVAVLHVGEAGVDVPRRAADDDYGYPDLLDDPDDEDDPSYGQTDGDDYGGLPVVLAEGGDGELLDTTAPDGYETSEVSAAKTLVGDILGADFGGYDNGDLDTLAAADQIINRLVAAGWRPTIADPYFVSEELLREIDRQRE